MNFTIPPSIDYWSKEYFNLGGDTLEFEKIIADTKENPFLERLISNAAAGKIKTKSGFQLSSISNLLRDDLRAIFLKYFKYKQVPENSMGVRNLDNLDLSGYDANLNVCKYVSPQIDNRTDFPALFRTAAVVIPILTKRYSGLTFEELFPNLSSKINQLTFAVEGMIECNNTSGLTGVYAPKKEDLVDHLDENNRVYDECKEKLRKLAYSLNFETQGVEEWSSDLTCDEPLNLRIVGHDTSSSDSTIAKNSIKAVPYSMRMRLGEYTETKRSQNPNVKKNEYRGEGTGAPYQLKYFYLQYVIEFKSAHVINASKRLLVANGKSFKNFDTSSIPLALDTLRTLVEFPNQMELDCYENSNRNTVFIFRSATAAHETSREDPEKDMKIAVTEVLSKNFKKVTGQNLFTFLKEMNNIQSDGIDSFNYRPDGFGVRKILVDFTDVVPESIDMVLTNLKDLKEYYDTCSKDIEVLIPFIEKKFKDLGIDPKKKVSPRDFMIKIVIETLKIDPLSLITKKSEYLKEIAKRFI
jgi:hypothetical protein